MNKRVIVALKAVVWLVSLTPLALLVYRGFTNDLGPDPTATVTHATGFATLRRLRFAHPTVHALKCFDSLSPCAW